MTRLRATLAAVAVLTAALLPAHNAEAARAHCGVRFVGGGQPSACQPVTAHTLRGPSDWWWSQRRS